MQPKSAFLNKWQNSPFVISFAVTKNGQAYAVGLAAALEAEAIGIRKGNDCLPESRRTMSEY